MTWNFRLIRHSEGPAPLWYAVHEVFYNDAGEPFTMTEDPVDITGESPAEVQKYLEMVQQDIRRLPILDMRRMKWAKSPWKEPVKPLVKDFDESQALHIPAKRFRKRRKKKS